MERKDTVETGSNLRKESTALSWSDISDARSGRQIAGCPVQAGKYEVDATVVKVERQGRDKHFRRVMVIKSTLGWRAWGSAKNGEEVGDKIKLRATFEPSTRDPLFGFFKHPKLITRRR